eukprot:TRINITY_DN8897_c0_g1_i1.p2 TRINITY_DN8897_c0_g1~~TRINITY_DN8897_c0_g1_i1.p2  ORF type:complete len:101 (-),score=2.57 TRINITY_DN8897_c0_g1_i1:625-927(-)
MTHVRRLAARCPVLPALLHEDVSAARLVSHAWGCHSDNDRSPTNHTDNIEYTWQMVASRTTCLESALSTAFGTTIHAEHASTVARYCSWGQKRGANHLPL